MTKFIKNIQENIYSDEFDTQAVSSLSLFLFDKKYILLSKDIKGNISGIHKKTFNDLRSLSFVLHRDKLYSLNIPKKVFLFQKPLALIPGLTFESSHIPLYLGFAEANKEKVSFLSSSLDKNDCYLVTNIIDELKEIFTNTTSHISFHHGSTSFLSYVLKDKNSYINEEIFISVFSHGFYLAAFKNNALTVFNVFDNQEKEGLMNYLAGIINHLDFDQNSCKVTLYGEYREIGINEDFGSTYFKNFVLDQPKANQKYQAGASIFQDSNIFESYWEY